VSRVMVRQGWRTKAVMDLKALIKTLVAKHLNESETISHQNSQLVQAVRVAALREYPELHRFEDLWPLTDLIKQRLAYTSTNLRRKAAAIAAANAMPSPMRKKTRAI